MTRAFRMGLSKLFLLSCAGVLPLAVVHARAGGEGQSEDEARADEATDDEDRPEWFCLVNGDVHTGTGALLRGATILAKDGVIHAIGYGVDIPEDAVRLDARRMPVYPGLVAFDSGGLLGGSSDLADSVDPFSLNMVLALGSGITATGQGGDACKLKRGEIEGVVMREKYLQNLSFSTDNPSNKRSLREKFERASKYMAEYREWEIKKKEDKELEEPSKKGVDAAVLSVLRGENLARFNADAREDLLDIARLAQKYSFRPVIQGCREGWTVADELGRAGAFAVVTPRTRSEKAEELVRDGGTSIENAAILHESGVQVCVIPGNRGVILMGIAGRDILHLQIEAGFAVRGGLPEDAALAAITIVPARLLGIDRRVGTLEVGKDCDLIVTDGDVLHYQTFVQYAVVEGKQVYDKQAELIYPHIRPRPEDPVLAPEQRLDPGEEPAPEPEETPPAAEAKSGSPHRRRS